MGSSGCRGITHIFRLRNKSLLDFDTLVVNSFEDMFGNSDRELYFRIDFD